jgi:hypothetical protein
VWSWRRKAARIPRKASAGGTIFQALSSYCLAMEPTEDSNKSVGYESDDVPLISLVTPNVSNKKRKKTLGGGAHSDPVSLRQGERRGESQTEGTGKTPVADKARGNQHPGCISVSMWLYLPTEQKFFDLFKNN